jgi:hypothetical protein
MRGKPQRQKLPATLKSALAWRFQSGVGSTRIPSPTSMRWDNSGRNGHYAPINWSS